MKTILAAILAGLLSLSASSVFAEGCEKQISPIGYDIPFHGSLGGSPEYLRELTVRLAAFRAFVKSYIEGYRSVGGELYWRHQKLQGKYARYVNQEYFKARSAVLAMMGIEMRRYLALEKDVLTPELRDSIQDALSDYGNLELPEALAPAQ